MLGIKRQHGLPQGDTPLLRQVVVGHAATVLPVQDKVHQPLVVQHQGLQASLAASLGTAVDDWPFQVQWMDFRHDTPPFDEILSLSPICKEMSHGMG